MHQLARLEAPSRKKTRFRYYQVLHPKLGEYTPSLVVQNLEICTKSCRPKLGNLHQVLASKTWKFAPSLATQNLEFIIYAPSLATQNLKFMHQVLASKTWKFAPSLATQNLEFIIYAPSLATQNLEFMHQVLASKTWKFAPSLGIQDLEICTKSCPSKLGIAQVLSLKTWNLCTKSCRSKLGNKYNAPSVFESKTWHCPSLGQSENYVASLWNLCLFFLGGWGRLPGKPDNGRPKRTCLKAGQVPEILSCLAGVP